MPLAEIIDFLVETGARIRDPKNVFMQECIDRMCSSHILPREVVAKLNDAMVRALRSPDIRERMNQIGFDVVASSPDEFGKFMREEVARWTRDGIRINTFMLDANSYLKSFVERLTQMNRGRAFFTTPETLGDYVLVDFIEQKRAMRGNSRRAG